MLLRGDQSAFYEDRQTQEIGQRITNHDNQIKIHLFRYENVYLVWLFIWLKECLGQEEGCPWPENSLAKRA